jgi:hypothetical protein
MSIFSKKTVQLPPHPQVYFEMLCDQEFGFNFTDNTIYSYVGDDFHSKLSKIWQMVKKAYPYKAMKIQKYGMGNLKVVLISMFDLPDDYYDDDSEYDFITA